jgi:hypothetical protein
VKCQPEAYDETVADVRAMRLDPARFPLRFVAPDATAEGGRRSILLNETRVVMTRQVAGMAMQVVVPVASYRGVTAKVLPGATSAEDRIRVVLLHNDRALDVSLYEADHDRDVVAEWRRWGEVLGLPLLIERVDGTVVAADERAATEAPAQPRRHASMVVGRRARFLTRRRPGQPNVVPFVHRGEDEIFPG